MKWSYKTVHFELKKEGLLGGAFLDETEIEQELNEFGRTGWELVSVLEVQDGIIAFFKQPLGVKSRLSPMVTEQQNSPEQEYLEEFPEDHPGSTADVGETPETGPEQEKVETDNGIGAIRIE